MAFQFPKNVSPVLTEALQSSTKLYSEFPVTKEIFPIVQVNDITGSLIIFTNNAETTGDSSLVAPGADIKKKSLEYTESSYLLIKYAETAVIPFETQLDLSNLDPMVLKLRVIENRINQQIEISSLSLLAGISNSAVASAAWSGATASQILTDIDSASNEILTNSGAIPNKLVLNLTLWNVLRNKFVGTNGLPLPKTEIENIIGMNVVVATNRMATTLLNDTACLVYVNDTLADPYSPSFGYTYSLLNSPFATDPVESRTLSFESTYVKFANPYKISDSCGFRITMS